MVSQREKKSFPKNDHFTETTKTQKSQKRTLPGFSRLKILDEKGDLNRANHTIKDLHRPEGKILLERTVIRRGGEGRPVGVQDFEGGILQTHRRTPRKQWPEENEKFIVRAAVKQKKTPFRETKNMAYLLAERGCLLRDQTRKGR